MLHIITVIIIYYHYYFCSSYRNREKKLKATAHVSHHLNMSSSLGF